MHLRHFVNSHTQNNNMIRRAISSSLRLARPFPVSSAPPRLARAERVPDTSLPKALELRSYVTKSTADEKIEDLQEL